MADRERFRPFTGDAEKKIRLSNAPLALVLCQIRWPAFTHLQGDITTLTSAFGSKLEEYPLISDIHEVAYTITPEGLQQTPGDKVVQWQSIDGHWRVNFGRRFVSIYCTSYTSFTDFHIRLQRILEALLSVVEIPLIERLGFRYVNQVTDPRLVTHIAEYVRPEVLGYAGLTGAFDEAKLELSANQARDAVGSAALQVRSGLVPPGETVDPAVTPADGPSWVLDLDASFEQIQPFEVESTLTKAGMLSDFAYDFFKYISTDGFLKEFGDRG